jgi:hypothetical protein
LISIKIKASRVGSPSFIKTLIRKGLYVKYSGIRSWVQRSLIYPISTVDLYFQAASAQDLEFALSVFSVKVVRHTESLHFGVTLWKSAGGLIGGKTRKAASDSRQ